MLRVAAFASSAALTLAALACGGSDGAPDPTATPTREATATPIASPPTARAATPSAVASPPAPATCFDPYPDGAPYVPEPGQPIRLRPHGSPPALAALRVQPLVRDAELERIVRFVLGPDVGRASVVIKRLDDGRGVAIDPDRVYYAASLFKAWVMLEAFHQRASGLLDFDEQYIVTPHYKSFGLNAGELAQCARATVHDAMRSMMRISDNVAANLLLDRVGAGNVNWALSALGLRRTSISPQTLSTSAQDMALLLEAIARRQAIDPAASDAMLELLASESIADRLPALLPKGTRVAHKTGNWENATHDAGIVFAPRSAYVIVVLTDLGFGDDGARLIAGLSRAVYDHFER